MLEREEVAAGHAAKRESRAPHGRQAHPPDDVRPGAADEPGRDAQFRQQAVEVMWDRPVDLVLDGRVDHQAQFPAVVHQPVADVVAQRLGREMPEQGPAMEMAFRFGQARPFGAALPGGRGGRHPVDDPEPLGGPEQPPLDRPDDGRIQQDDRPEEVRPGHGCHESQVPPQGMPHPDHRLGVAALDVPHDLREEVGPALGGRVARVHAQRRNGSDPEMGLQQPQHAAVAGGGKAVGVGKMEHRAAHPGSLSAPSAPVAVMM